MKDYLFIDNETGEEFFIERESKHEAFEFVWQEFGQNSDIEYEGCYSVEEADILGYDTY